MKSLKKDVLLPYEVSSPLCAGYWRQSIFAAKSVRILCVAAVLTALQCVFSTVLCFPMSILGTEQKITGAFLAGGIAAMVYGPITAVGAGILVDTLTYLIRPSGGYLPVFMVVPIMAQLIYALCFFRQKITLWRIILAKGLVSVVCNIFLNSTLIYVLYGLRAGGTSYWVYVLARAPKNLILLPLEILCMYLLFRALVPELGRLGLHPATQRAKRGVSLNHS